MFASDIARTHASAINSPIEGCPAIADACSRWTSSRQWRQGADLEVHEHSQDGRRQASAELALGTPLERRRDKFGADFALTIDHSLRPFGETIDNTQPATGQPLLVRRQSNRDLPRTRRVAHEDAEPPAETVFALQSLADDDGLSHCSSLE